MSAILPLARQLGEKMELVPIEKLEPIAMPRRPNPACWPPEVAAEMQRIWNEEQSHDQQ